jgi:hypothetical protein
MKSLFNQSEYNETRQRIETLTSENARKWGKMDIAQMLAHCSIGFEHAIGKVPFKDKSNFIMRVLVKRLVLNAIKKGDLGKNQKTFPEYAITGERDFDTEKQRLLKALDEFYEFGKDGHINRHPYFGKFSKEDWGALQYVHTNHHLIQFSA